MTEHEKIQMLEVVRHLKNKAMGYARYARDNKRSEDERKSLIYAKAMSILQAEIYMKE